MLNIKKAEKIKTVDDQKPDDIGNVETYCSLTQAEYDELSEAEKNNGIVYYITDGSIEQIDASSVRYDNSNSHISSTSVQGALDSLDTMLGSIGSGELAELQEVLDDAQIALDSVQPIIPSSPGTAGQVLTKTSTGADWEDINALPSGGDTGQVLTKVSSTTGDVTWVTPKEGTVDAVNGISPDANKNVQIDVELTQAQYDALPSTKNSDNINYYITDGTSNSEYNTISASGILYDNTDSGLTAATVQEAIDEFKNGLIDINISSSFTLSSTGSMQGLVRAYYTPAIHKVHGFISAYTDGTTIDTGTSYCSVSSTYRPSSDVSFPAVIKRSDNVLYPYYCMISSTGTIMQKLSSTSIGIYGSFEYYIQ